MSAKILVINDDPYLDIVLQRIVGAINFQVVSINSAIDIDSELRTAPPELIVLNAPFAGLAAIELCRTLAIQKQGNAISVLLLTKDNDDAARCLELGADDSLTKPFSDRELIDRVNALLQRTQPNFLATVLRIGSIELDRKKKLVSRSGRLIRIGPSEYRLLEFLMKRTGRVFSRVELIRGLWGGIPDVNARTVDVYIGRLRSSLNLSNERDPIRTVRGTGYAFDEKFVAAPNMGLRKRRSRPIESKLTSHVRRQVRR